MNPNDPVDPPSASVQLAPGCSTSLCWETETSRACTIPIAVAGHQYITFSAGPCMLCHRDLRLRREWDGLVFSPGVNPLGSIIPHPTVRHDTSHSVLPL